MIRPTQSQDVDIIVAIHLKSFPGFFLTFLGPRFLKLYYSRFSEDSGGISFVYMDNSDVPVGFVAGSCNPRRFYSNLLRRDWFRFSFASLGAILKMSIGAKRVARALFHPSKNPVGDEVAGLFSLGVMTEFHCKGVGKKLAQSFLNEAKRRGCKKVFLTTDRDNNEIVNGFYQKLGFHIERQYETPEGRRMNEYWIKLT